MKRQKKQFVVILIALAVVLVATIGMKTYNKNQEEKETAEEEASTIYISQVQTDSITSFSYEIGEVTYSFTKDGEDWIYDGDSSVDIDEDAVETMLNSLEALTATDEINCEDLSEYGLEEPSDVISYTTDSGSVTLSVGNKNDMLGSYYVMTGEDGKVYLTNTSLADVFSKTPEELTASEDTESVENTENAEAAEVTESTETVEEGTEE